MKRIAGLLIWGLFVLVACAQPTPEYVEGMINRGDEIEGMRFTVDDEFDFPIVVHSFCGFDPKEKIDNTAYYECVAQPGDNISFGTCLVVGVNTTEDLDDKWKELLKSEITFDGKAIYLPNFGSVDFTAWNGMKARGWNVIVENITPGIHTIQCRCEFEDVFYEDIFYITVPTETEIYPTLSTEMISGRHRFTSEHVDLNYFLDIPPGYGINPQEEWPLILSLHGLDQGVMKSMDLLEDVLLTPPENWDDFPFIVVSPQGRGEYSFWSTLEMDNALMTLLDEIKEVVAVDLNRIYLTGVSAGGNGTWEIGLRHPDRFAALVPIAGYYGYPFKVPDNICDLKDVPIWAFHGENDEVIPLDAQQMLVDSLDSCDGNIHFTIFPDIGHELEGGQVYTAELFIWLLEQTLK